MKICNRGAVNKWSFNIENSLTYFLLSLTSRQTGLSVRFIADPVNTVVSGNNVFLYFTETETEDAVNGDITISPQGDWDMTLYNQSSSTNLDPSLADTELLTEVIRVDIADAAATGFTGTCADAVGNDFTLVINYSGAEVYNATVDASVNNTINIS